MVPIYLQAMVSIPAGMIQIGLPEKRQGKTLAVIRCINIHSIVTMLVSAFFIFPVLYPAFINAESLPQIRFEITNAPYRVWGDKVIWNRETEVVTIEGNVRIRQEDRLLSADTVRIYLKENRADAEGNITMDAPQGTVKGSWAQIDFGKEIGEIRYGEIFLRQGNYRFSGDVIEKKGPETYFARNGTLTTCNGQNPVWRFKGREMVLRLDDVATIHGARFEIKGVPILYSPWLSIPTRVTRQSGFLNPSFSFSDRDGAGFELPYYWAISKNTDLTIYPNPMTKRGWKQGAEYRYILTPESKGALNFDYLYDTKEDDDLYDDGFLRENKHRWWLRSRINHTLPYDIDTKVDLDLASDQDFLREFKSGFNGFWANSSYYGKKFGRNIEDETALFRQTKASAVKNWDHFGLRGSINYFQGLTDEESNEYVPQRLPRISFRTPLNPLYGLPVYYSLNSDYSYFWRESGSNAHRMEISPLLSAPIAMGRFATLSPFAQARGFLYNVNSDDSTTDDSGFGHQLQTVLGTELSSYISKVHDVSWGRINKVRHVIKPFVTYEYSTINRSEGLPTFDPFDELESINRVTFKLENNLVAKSTGPGGNSIYRDLIRFRLLQSYDLKEAQRELYGPDDERRPFSNLRGEFEFYPTNRIALLLDTTFNPYEAEFRSLNTYFRAADMRGDLLQIDYRYTKDSVEEINTHVNLQITDQLNFLGYSKTSLLGDKNIEAGVGLGLRFQCWGLRLMYKTSTEDTSVGLTFSLSGIGDIQSLSLDI